MSSRSIVHELVTILPPLGPARTSATYDGDDGVQAIILTPALAERRFAPLAAVWEQKGTLKTDHVATAGTPPEKWIANPAATITIRCTQAQPP
jgi:hypothetical protein